MPQHTIIHGMDTTDDTERLISEEQAAARLGLLAQTLRMWRHKGLGRLPYFRIGKCIRYKPSEIAAYIAQQRQPAAEEK